MIFRPPSRVSTLAEFNTLLAQAERSKNTNNQSGQGDASPVQPPGSPSVSWEYYKADRDRKLSQQQMEGNSSGHQIRDSVGSGNVNSSNLNSSNLDSIDDWERPRSSRTPSETSKTTNETTNMAVLFRNSIRR